MKWSHYGRDAWLLQFADRVGADAYYLSRTIVAELERHPPPGLVDFVPAFTTVLLEFEPQQSDVESVVLPEFVRHLKVGMAAKFSTAPVIEIPVRYDGPDLGRVSELSELAPGEVVALHSAPVYTVYILGFAPGFPYLGELDERLHTPRLESPRTKVPAGAVAIGGQHTGIYPLETPGGWNLIGRTDVRVFDPSRPEAALDPREMFLLKPGDRVRFVPI